MPDGPSVEIRVTADTSGLDQVQTRAQRLSAELQRTGGDLAKVNALFVETGQRAQEAATGISAAGNAARQAAGGLAASQAASQQAAAGLEKVKVNSGEVREAVVLLHEVVTGRFDRMAGSVLVMTERMGGLSTVVGALKGPFGIAALGAVALGGALYEIVSKANAAAAALRNVYNASLLMGGVSASGARAGAQAALGALSTQNVMGSSAVDKFVQQVYSLGDASDSAKQKLTALGPALYVALGQDDKALERYVEHFKDTSSLKSFIEEQGLATQAQAAAVEQAAAAKDADTLRAIALDTLTKRLSASTAAIDANARSYGRGLHVPLPDLAQMPETPAGVRPQAIQQALEWQQKYNRVANETAGIEQDIAALMKARMAASTDAARAQYDTMIKTARAQEAALADRQDKQLGQQEQDYISKAPRAARTPRAPSATAARGGGAEARSEYEDFAAGERDKIADAEGSSTQIQAIYQEWAARAKAQFGDTSREYANVMRQMTETAQREAKEQARALAEANSQAYEQFAGAERDKIAAADGATAKILAIYQQWVDRAKAVFGQQSKEYEAVVKQMTDATNRAAQQMQESFAKPFDTLGSSLEGAVTGLLTHQTTAGKAEQEAYRSLIGSGVHELGGALNTSLSSAIFGSGTKSLGEGLMKAIGVGGAGGLFGTGIGAVSAETTQATLTTAVTANTAAITANTAALTTSAGASVGGGALSLGSAAGGIGGFISGVPVIGGFLGSLFGGGGAAADQDFSGGVLGFARGGIMPRISASTYSISALPSYRIPSYAGGGIAIPGLAKLHENEMVLDSRVSNFVQNASAAYAGGHGGAGGGDTHVHMEGATVLDGPSFSRYLQTNGKQAINDMIKSAFRSNALTPRTV